jgi:ankyrin repeat protein
MIHADRRQTIAATVACGLILAVAVVLWRDRPGARGRALRVAVRMGNLGKVERLLRRGANPNKTATDGTALADALVWAEPNREEMIALLVSHGADPNEVLHGDSDRIQHISPEALSLFAKSGADFKSKDKEGNTLLHRALQFAYAKKGIIPILLANGTDPDLRDSLGETPLMKAAGMQSPRAAGIVELLIAHGADVNAKGREGYIPLCRYPTGNEDVMIALVEGGSDLTAPDAALEDRPPLLMAIRARKFRAARAMVEKGANVNAKDKWGATPLSMVARHGDLGLVRMLVEKGANINAANLEGYTPLHAAAAAHRQDMAAYLISKGAKINGKTSAGQTPLAYARMYGGDPSPAGKKRKEALTQYLVAQGAE